MHLRIGIVHHIICLALLIIFLSIAARVVQGPAHGPCQDLGIGPPVPALHSPADRMQPLSDTSFMVQTD